MKTCARTALVSILAAFGLAVYAPAPRSATDTAYYSWKRFHAFNDQLQFSYPADLLDVFADSSSVTLSHSIPFRHPDDCNFEDEEWLDRLLDFRLTLQVDPRPCMEALKNWYPYAVKPRRTHLDVFGPDSLIPEIYTGSTGSWRGHMVHASVEGCGKEVSFFYAGSQTLVEERTVIGIFITTWIDTVLTLPGVISPDKERELFSDITRSVSLVIPTTESPSALRESAKRSDRTPPHAPNVRVVHIKRGFGEWGNEETRGRDSNSREGEIYLETEGVSDDRTPADSLRYRIHFVDGNLPHGMILNCNEVMRPFLPNHRDIILRWTDGNVWNQEPFNFKLSVTAVDLAGNESKPSVPVAIASDGDPSEMVQELREKEPGVVSTYDLPEDAAFETSYSHQPAKFPRVPLTVQEYPLPKGAAPNEKYLKRYKSTFLREIEADLAAWHPTDPTLPAPDYTTGIRQSFELDDARYHVQIDRNGHSQARVRVLRDDKPIFEAQARHPASESPVVTFYWAKLPESADPKWGTWNRRSNDHWILEYWNHVVIDSVELNDRHNFQATFFYRIVAGKPFYFAKVYGQVRVCWSNAIAEQKYDEILYAPRASPQLSPQHYENAAAFYARRGQQWFYVLAGFPGK